MIKTDIKLSESEHRLMDVLWEKGSIPAMELARICLEKYGWKKSTVYTMLKRMGQKELLLFENKMVEALVKRDQANKSEGESLLYKAYGGSLAELFASFLQDRKLTNDEADRLQKLIEEAKE